MNGPQTKMTINKIINDTKLKKKKYEIQQKSTSTHFLQIYAGMYRII